MTKQIILSAEAEEAISAGDALMKGAAGGVKVNTAVGTCIGFAKTDAALGDEVGVIKSGIVRLPNTNAEAYVFGQAVEMGAANEIKTGATNFVGVAAETKTTTADDPKLYVLVNILNLTA